MKFCYFVVSSRGVNIPILKNSKIKKKLNFYDQVFLKKDR